MTECTYCESNVEHHDPVFTTEIESGQRVPAGQFCNYACLSAFVEEEKLTYGAACEWSPDD
jgi:hypothetical protein